jgi:lipoyl(octanoyl) transferase
VHGELVFARLGLDGDPLDYLDAWELQRRVHEQRVRGEIPDTCLLLEHAPVYTAGKRTTPLDRPVSDPGAPVIDVDRGGNITWHGPGQLVGYPIVLLDGRRGAWVAGRSGRPDRKVAAIGVRVARGVTMHGFALNCDCDLSWYDRIVPCGISDAAVTSLSAETGGPVRVADVLPVAERHLAAALNAASVSRMQRLPSPVTAA